MNNISNNNMNNISKANNMNNVSNANNINSPQINKNKNEVKNDVTDIIKR
jgi:hypothetical protein